MCTMMMVILTKSVIERDADDYEYEEDDEMDDKSGDQHHDAS